MKLLTSLALLATLCFAGCQRLPEQWEPAYYSEDGPAEDEKADNSAVSEELIREQSEPKID